MYFRDQQSWYCVIKTTSNVRAFYHKCTDYICLNQSQLTSNKRLQVALTHTVLFNHSILGLRCNSVHKQTKISFDLPESLNFYKDWTQISLNFVKPSPLVLPPSRYTSPPLPPPPPPQKESNKNRFYAAYYLCTHLIHYFKCCLYVFLYCSFCFQNLDFS